MSPRKFDPLSYTSLSDSLKRELLSSDLYPLSDVEQFEGSGVYALFYSGDFEPYRLLSDQNRKQPGSFPIYIGKAAPQTMTGIGIDFNDGDTDRIRLYKRINDHRKSIENALNINIQDFSCKILVLNAIWVPLAESSLIATYTPVWNSMMGGFGNHPPGSNRIGKLSKWDTVHPGRARETGIPNERSLEKILLDVTDAIRERHTLLFGKDAARL